MIKLSFQIFILVLLSQCSNQDQNVEQVNIERIVLDESDRFTGYYLAVKPPKEQIEGVLVLLNGFGQPAETIFTESKLHQFAQEQQLLTIGISVDRKLYLDQAYENKLNRIIKDVVERFEVQPDQFVIGGFSAGGVIGLRYTEVCKEFPDQYPINPQAVFTVDSPVDIFTIWENFEEAVKYKYSEVAVQEAEFIMNLVKTEHGVPRENVELFSKLSPFAINKEYGENERFLKDIPVRVYHDVDVSWRLRERNQPVRVQNYVMTSELINRLLLLGNEQAEFIQSYQTGYRSNGQRHPHSWSVVDEEKCIQWIKVILKK